MLPGRLDTGERASEVSQRKVGSTDICMHLTADRLETKRRALHDIIRGYGSAVIGFSGGVDSAYLGTASLGALGADGVLAVTGRSPSYPRVQRAMALRVVASIGLPHLEIDTHELGDPDYARNPSNRCYFCKAELYGRLVEIAKERGFAVVFDGSNADDLDDHRPGLAAARELGVRSPLQEAGLTKSDVRALSRRAGLPTAELPASPCLASRIPYGLQVTRTRLGQIEAAEEQLRELEPRGGFRVRHHDDWARLELAPAELERLLDPLRRGRVADALRSAGFPHACLDIQGYRRGALNEVLTGGSAGGGTPAGAGEPEREAERRLRDIGIVATVMSAGPRREIAVLRPRAVTGLFQRAMRAARLCRQLGYGHAALELY